MPVRWFPLCIATVLVAWTAHAARLNDRAPELTTPVPVSEGAVVSAGSAGSRFPVAATAYEALTPGTMFAPTGLISPIDGLPYGEYADDCHLVVNGPLSRITIGYYEPSAPQVAVEITLYANDAEDGMLGPVVAGPYLFTGLPGGGDVVQVLTLTPPDSPMIPKDVWFAVSFTPNTAGLVLSPSPSPTIGWSHDVALDTTPPGVGLVSCGGSPVANLMIGIAVNPVALPAEPATWGQIKARFQAP